MAFHAHSDCDLRTTQGVLVAGRNPYCIMFARGHMRIHPLKLDRGEGVRSSARFQNDQCSDGLVFIADKGSVAVDVVLM